MVLVSKIVKLNIQNKMISTNHNYQVAGVYRNRTGSGRLDVVAVQQASADQYLYSPLEPLTVKSAIRKFLTNKNRLKHFLKNKTFIF